MAAVAAGTGRDAKVIGLICFPHLLSHLYFLVLPPLFPVLKQAFAVSYTELGLALTVFGAAAGLGQTPVGFLVDRIGGRALLIGGLVLQAGAVAMIGLAESYWQVLALCTVAGIAHTVFHPADYAILSAAVERSRLGRAYGIHSFTGNIGFVAAPVIMVTITELWHWRAAFVIVGAVGLAFALVLWWKRDLLGDDLREAAERRSARDNAGDNAGDKGGLALLVSLPILMCFAFFVLQMMGMGGLRTFLVATLDALFATPLAEVNTALFGLLVGSAAGILLGAGLADRFGPRVATAFATLLPASALIFVIGSVPMPLVLLTGVLALIGFLQGFLIPSRDLLIRSVTPDGSMGKVMGFVSSGANLAGGLVPLLFGWILDTYEPVWIFWLSALFVAGALFTFVTVKGRFG